MQKFQISNFKFAEKNGYCVVDCIVENKQKYRITPIIWLKCNSQDLCLTKYYLKKKRLNKKGRN